MSKRGLATSLATRSGLLAVVERLPSRPLLAVLVYHRILRREDADYNPNVIEATPEQFDEQVAMLKRRHHVVEPLEMLELVENPSKLRHLSVALTFDDGYHDSYDYAFPILRSHGLRATFFLPTAFVGTDRLAWWDQIAWVLRHTKRTTLELTYPRALTIRLAGSTFEESTREVLRLVKGDAVDMPRFLRALADAAAIDVPAAAARPQFLSWEHAHEMERAGMMIASHTHTHRILAQLPPDEQEHECARARDVLRANKLGGHDCLAYPVGERGSFDEASQAIARRAGYRFGFSNYGGVNEPGRMSAYDIRRCAIGSSPDAGRQLRVRLAFAGLAAREPW